MANQQKNQQHTLETEVEKLAQENSMLRDRIQDLSEQLHTIQNAKTFKVWQHSVLLRKNGRQQLRRTLKAPKLVAKKFIPLYMRKKMKAKAERLFLPALYKLEIPRDVREEWSDWDKQRSDGSMDVLIFGITKYDFRIQRPQHLAEELANLGNRIFYIEHEFIHAKKNNTTFAPFKVARHRKNVYKITIAAYENLFIYQDRLSDQNKAIMLASIRSLIKEATIVNPIAKIDHPFWGTLQTELAMPVIYDCMDEHKGFKHFALHLEKLEAQLIKTANIVLASSDYLYKKIKDQKPKQLVMIKNAGDYDHFKHARNRHAKQPADIIDLPQPIIGYYGAIAEWFDDNCIDQVAKTYPNASIVLIGKVDNKKIQRLAASRKNIHLLGEKPYEDLPRYLQEFDVCLIPFIINDLIKATSPVKIYEYLAAGKPVVATNIPELAPYNDVVYVAQTPKRFVEAIAKALDEDDEAITLKRQAIAQENTWQKRAAVLQQSMTTTCFPKVSVIILTFNKPAYTKLCIESVLHRSFYPNLEVILVDNASIPETVKLVKSYAKDPRVKIVLNKTNTGFSKGNNIGLAAATGDYLLVFNNDAVITPGWISRLVFHARKPRVGLVGPVTNGIGNEAKIDLIYDTDSLNDMEQAAREYTSAHWGETLELKNLAAFCWILHRSLYKKIGGFDEAYGKAYFEDDDYCMMVKKQGLKLLCADDVFVHHYWGSTDKTVDDFLVMENRKRFEQKWHVTWQPHKYRNQ